MQAVEYGLVNGPAHFDQTLFFCCQVVPQSGNTNFYPARWTCDTLGFDLGGKAIGSIHYCKALLDVATPPAGLKPI